MAIAAALCVWTWTSTDLAAGATYEVTFGGAGSAGWSHVASAGFVVDGWRIDAEGPVATAGSGELVLRPDTPDLRIASAQLTARVEIGAPGLIGRAASLDAGAVTTTAVAGGAGTHRLDVDRPGDALSIGLLASGTVGAGSASMELVSATVVLDDLRAPRVAGAAAAVHGNCIRVAVTAIDAESGIASVMLRERRSLAVLATWSAPIRAGEMHPGAPALDWQPCIPVSALTNGIRSVDVDVVDVAGQHTFGTITDLDAAAGAGLLDGAAPRPGAAAAAGTLTLAALGRTARAATFGSRSPLRVRVTRAGAPVGARVVQLRSADGSVLGSARTAMDGIATIVATFRTAGPFTVVAPGSSASMRIPLRISPRVRWTTSGSAARLGAVVRLRGQVRPAAACASVTLQARRGAGWFVVRRGARCSADGAFTIPVTANARGTFRLRAQVATRGSWHPGQSSTRPLRVN